MRTILSKWRLLAVAATALCGSILATNAHAAAATHLIVPIVNVQFNPSLCSASTAKDVVLNGAYHFTFHTSRNPDGTYTTKIQSEAHGTAVDENNQDYVFSYINHEQDLHSSPADVPPLLITYSDRFNLNSKGGGGALNVSVAFQVVLSVDAQGNFTLVSLVAVKGDPNCDPI